MFTASPPMDERRTEVKYAAGVQNGTDFFFLTFFQASRYAALF